MRRVLRSLLALAVLALPAAGAATAARAAGAVPESFADLAASALPAVVNISTTQIVKRDKAGPERPQFPPGSPFEEFFKEFLDKQNRPDAPPRRVQSLGSGFVIDPAGYIATNNHVVKDADEIVVRFQDDSTLEAKVVGRDTKTDLALIKVEPKKPLAALKWGDSDAARIGDWVVAIGNPFGLGGSVTAGIVSARQRDINSGPYDDYLQTDAAINRGNSGGPMLNAKGEVIGINTAIFSPSGGSVGIGFAVPASLAEPVFVQLRETGQVRRGWLGVRIQSLNDEIAESLGMKGDAHGALVAAVTPNGPAAKAGIESGDVIVTFDGKPVEKMRRLPRIVAETQVGKQVAVEVWHKGSTSTRTVTLGELKDEDETKSASLESGEAAEPSVAVKSLGLTVAAIDDAARQRFDLASDAQGVVVTAVDADGAAQERGVQTGDVLVEVNQDQVRSPKELAKRVQTAMADGKRTVLLLVDRKGDLRFVAVTLRKE